MLVLGEMAGCSGAAPPGAPPTAVTAPQPTPVPPLPTATPDTALAVSIGQATPGNVCGGGSPARTAATSDAAIGRALGAQFGSLTVPYRNSSYSVVSNDGTFARVLVCAQLRKSAADSWQDYIADLQFSNVGGRWSSSSYRGLQAEFKPLDEWKKLEASQVAAARIHAQIIRVEARERPKTAFSTPGSDYVATVRWTTDDRATHVIRYGLWLAVDGHHCVPSSSFLADAAQPKDSEQQVALSWPIGADGNLDLQAPPGQVSVGAEPVEQAYGLQWMMTNKEDLNCSTIDNPHGQLLEIQVVDGTRLATPLDNPPATPSPGR